MISLGALAPGETAYVDAEWIPRATAAVFPALIAGSEGIRWCERAAVPLPRGLDPEQTAALALLSVARGAASAAEGRDAEVEVTGRGLVAQFVRKLVRRDRHSEGPVPVIVETTGDPAAVIAATERLSDLGLLVLAGEPAGRRLDLNIYRDVHVRGLEIVGIPSPLRDSPPPTPSAEDLSAVEEACTGLARLRQGEPFTPGALWYAVQGG